MSNILRYLSPPLAALVAYFLRIGTEDKVKGAELFRFIGVMLPALWLQGLGPGRLLAEGGFMMQLLHIKATRLTLTLFGIFWLAFGLVFYTLYSWANFGCTIQTICYGLFYAGITSSVGVFLFLSLLNDPNSKR